MEWLICISPQGTRNIPQSKAAYRSFQNELSTSILLTLSDSLLNFTSPQIAFLIESLRYRTQAGSHTREDMYLPPVMWLTQTQVLDRNTRNSATKHPRAPNLPYPTISALLPTISNAASRLGMDGLCGTYLTYIRIRRAGQSQASFHTEAVPEECAPGVPWQL